MTFTLFIWLIFTASGLITAALSWRLANIVLHAVTVRNAPQNVIDGTRHLQRNQQLITLGWLLFFSIGVIALFNPAPEPQPALTPIGFLITWMLVGAVILWSIMTIGDYLLSRAIWRRETASQHKTV